MNYKFLFFILYLFTLLLTIQTNEIFDIQSDTDIMNEIGSIIRRARSFGCNGPKDKNVRPCRDHCIGRNYKGGRCTKASNYTRCQCLKSPGSKS